MALWRGVGRKCHTESHGHPDRVGEFPHLRRECPPTCDDPAEDVPRVPLIRQPLRRVRANTLQDLDSPRVVARAGMRLCHVEEVAVAVVGGGPHAARGDARRELENQVRLVDDHGVLGTLQGHRDGAERLQEVVARSVLAPIATAAEFA